jgi:DNA-binding response OmpR family regulator
LPEDRIAGRSTRVLVVDDEPAITEFIELGLSREGFEVRTAGDGRAALTLVDRFRPDVVILDIMMPRLDGFQLTKELAGERARSLIILSARDETQDRIAGLELGADDYLVKPFDFGELLARVRSVLRRRQPEQAVLLRAGPLELDRAERRTSYRGEPVELSPREFDLLCYLAEHRGQVLERDRILNAVWGVSFYGDDNNLEVYVRYLRRKLGDSDRQLIQTVRGVGYRLVVD